VSCLALALAYLALGLLLLGSSPTDAKEDNYEKILLYQISSLTFR
jgi:hypothetical protein